MNESLLQFLARMRGDPMDKPGGAVSQVPSGMNQRLNLIDENLNVLEDRIETVRQMF